MDGDVEDFLGLDVDLAECLQNCPEWNVSFVKGIRRERGGREGRKWSAMRIDRKKKQREVRRDLGESRW